jgi:hypothetical protein
VRSEAYRAAQAEFEQCQATFDPNTIAALLQRCPYQVDALMAMYDLYRHMGGRTGCGHCTSACCTEPC